MGHNTRMGRIGRVPGRAGRDRRARRRRDRPGGSPGARAGVARSRRPRRRRVRAARRRGDAAVGGGRAGDRPPDLRRGGPAGHRATSRLRRRTPGESLHRVPPDRGRRTGWADGPLRCPRRGVERSAVVLARLVPPSAPDDPAPRARPDVGPDHAAAPRRRRTLPRGAAGAAVLPTVAHRHAVGGDPRGAHRARLPGRSRHGRRQRCRPVLHARVAIAGRIRQSSPSPVWPP